MWGCRLGLLLLLLAGQAALEARRSRWRRELAPGLHLRGIRDAGGRYCQEQDMCCRGRADECALPYLGATCYCDLFCNRTVSDCCPDFWDFCLGIPPPFPPVQGGHRAGQQGGHLVYPSPDEAQERTLPGFEKCRKEILTLFPAPPWKSLLWSYLTLSSNTEIIVLLGSGAGQTGSSPISQSAWGRWQPRLLTRPGADRTHRAGQAVIARRFYPHLGFCTSETGLSVPFSRS